MLNYDSGDFKAYDYLAPSLRTSANAIDLRGALGREAKLR